MKLSTRIQLTRLDSADPAQPLLCLCDLNWACLVTHGRHAPFIAAKLQHMVCLHLAEGRPFAACLYISLPLRRVQTRQLLDISLCASAEPGSGSILLITGRSMQGMEAVRLLLWTLIVSVSSINSGRVSISPPLPLRATD